MCGSVGALPQGGRVWSHRTRGGTGALFCREAGSGATGHVVALEPTFVGRQGPVLHGTWRHVDACLTLCLDLKLICRGIRSALY
jgi:hypothetical protein